MKVKGKMVTAMMLRLILIIMLTAALIPLPVSGLQSVQVSSSDGRIQSASGSSNTWVWVRDTITGAYGEAVVGTGDAIYIARKSSFYRYRPADNSWVALAAPPNPDAGDVFKTGTALAWDFGDFIYALYGAATTDSRRWFYRYSISSDSWESLANTTVDQGEGNAITYVSIDNCIYATIGGEQRPTYFMRYDPSTNSWSDAPADPLAGMGDGASLVWTGGDYMYALRGEFLETEALYDFWRYSLTDNSWTAMSDIPALPHSEGSGGVGDGGSLLYVGHWLPSHTDYIYALSGNQAHPDNIPDNRFYRYKISTNNWERLADLPFGIGYYVGNRLGYANGRIYAWQGTPSTWAGGGDDLAYYEADTTPPNTTDDYDGLWHTQDFTITLTATDDLSGVAETYYKINDGPTKTVSADGQPLITTEGANNTLEYWSVDNAGNEELPHKILTGIKLDKTAPTIGVPSQMPESDIQPNEEVKVSVNVTDLVSKVKNVTLYYTNDTVWQSVPMVFNATSGLWEATIPGHVEATQVKYRVEAYDNAGNLAVEDNAGQYYTYTVIPEFPTAPILLLFMVLSVIALSLQRKTSKENINLNPLFFKFFRVLFLL